MSRGGFRGGGGANRSGAQQLMSFDLMKDLGVNGLFNVQTDLFPKMDVPIPRKPSSTEQTQWQLRRDYLERVKQTPYHITVPPPPKDIERYSDRYKQTDGNKRKLRDIKTDLDMFPEELQSIMDPSKATKRTKKSTQQDDYGQIEALLDKASDEKDEDVENKEKAAGSDAELEEEEEYEDEEDLVDDNDYGQNYFDNGEDDGDGDDDGDGEGYY